MPCPPENRKLHSDRCENRESYFATGYKITSHTITSVLLNKLLNSLENLKGKDLTDYVLIDEKLPRNEVWRCWLNYIGSGQGPGIDLHEHEKYFIKSASVKFSRRILLAWIRSVHGNRLNSFAIKSVLVQNKIEGMRTTCSNPSRYP
jgi:hypothetical protein